MTRRRVRRAPPEGSLSFLDVICCGFGSIILLLMITKTVQPQIIEASTVNLQGKLAELQEQLFNIRGETTVLNRDLNARQEQVSEYEKRIAILRGQLASAKSRFDNLQVDTSADAAISGQLAVAKQELTEEMKRLLGTQHQSKNDAVLGIPVDSEYIIFVIDTSGSMIDARERLLKVLGEALSIYPKVKGMQVLDHAGKYLFASYRGKWIPDSPARRKVVIQNLRNWNSNARSNPVPGIREAIDRFYDPSKRISIYVLGDEFPRDESIDDVIDTVNRINRTDAKGIRRVRIHAIGFPTPVAEAQGTRDQFAKLMRKLTSLNGGTFVALNDFR